MLSLAVTTPTAAQNIFTMQGVPVVVGSGYQFDSAALADTRQVNIMLPPGYEDEQQRTTRYPVLYLLDGGAPGQDFFHIAGLVHQARLWGTIQPLIVVGVESKDRRREFTDPSANPAEQRDFPTHGRSELFRRFLVNELRPAIDAA